MDRNATIRSTFDKETIEIRQSPRNPSFVQLQELLEKNMVAEAIDFAHNNTWVIKDLIRASKERISVLVKRDPHAAIKLMLAMRDNFPNCSSDLINELANGMKKKENRHVLY